jgi:threonyl-tRNA synthetase
MDLNTLRHSCSHIMASAVKKLYPEAKLGIGPAIEDGFYYDFDIPQGIKEEDLEKIEKLMQEEIGKDYSFIKEEWTKEKAIDFFKEKGEVYKVELIKELPDEKVSIYRHNDFIDLCKGPHLESTGRVKYFKLLSISGAYWKGKETNPQLVRIYGTAFFNKEDLDNFLKNLEETKRRDHRLLGRQLGLFDIYYNQAGAGLVFYLPYGAILRRIIEDWEIKEHLKRGYQLVITPHIMEKKLWEKSGHLEYYQEYMYPINKENQEFILKPMNCPGHILIYKSQIRSWRSLPLRFFELGTVYRYEKSGVLHGLLRVRGFTQDDAHIFCKKDDLYQEIENILDFVKEAMKKFGFVDFDAELSTRPEKFIGDKEDWDLAENILEDVLKKKGFNYKINYGEGAFYGPKIDIKLKDALKREWQCATIQLDYNIPKRFNLTYRNKEGKEEVPIMIHRVILGSLERFIATLIEHYAGRFPFWLAPVQIVILNITDEVKDYALRVKEILQENNFRVEVDLKSETLQKKIREKEMLKVPYLVIVGKKEKEREEISVRKRGREDLGKMKIEKFLEILKKGGGKLL